MIHSYENHNIGPEIYKQSALMHVVEEFGSFDSIYQLIRACNFFLQITFLYNEDLDWKVLGRIKKCNVWKMAKAHLRLIGSAYVSFLFYTYYASKTLIVPNIYIWENQSNAR